MMQVSVHQSIFIQIEPIDFRKGLDSLIGVCRVQLKQSPFSGAIFAFKNRRQTSVKLLSYDGSGFWLMHKRFSKGKLKYWPKYTTDKVTTTILLAILNQGTPGEFEEPWKPLPSSSASMAL